MQREPVQIHEVAPRDGLQNEPEVVSTQDKLALIIRLSESGLKDIEVTSFVRPSWIPQLADASELISKLPKLDGVRYWALVPNRRGLERAIAAGVEHVATFMSASQIHNQKNLNRTQRETLSGLRAVHEIAKDEGLVVRSYISTVFGCPYEGEVSPEATLDLSHQLLASGADIIALGDTTGMANPRQVAEMIHRLVDSGIPVDRLSLHLHDTRGTALANALAGYQAGVRCFDGSAAGVGGCPYAPGASGNAATDDLVHMFEAMGISTGVDLEALTDAGLFLSGVLGRILPGRYHQYRSATASLVSRKQA
jgi:hydroxymethylglutaryl-CoA lyase